MSLGLALAAVAASCASVPVDPCSRAGIEKRMTSSLKSFAVRNRADIRTLQKATQYLGGESVSGKMQIVFAVDALSRLVEAFGDDVVPEITAISDQCGSTDDVKAVFLDFLKDEGVGDKVLQWVEGLSIDLEVSST